MHYKVVQVGSHIGNTGNDLVFNKVEPTDNAIFIEPVPFLFSKLIENYTKKCPNNNFIFINKAVSNHTDGQTMFITSERNDYTKHEIYASMLSSFLKGHIETHIPKLIVEEKYVETITLNNIFEYYGVEAIDYLNTDTEGHDFEILMDLDLNFVKPSKITFEHHHMDGTFSTGRRYEILMEHFSTHGYRLTHQTASDTTIDLM